MSSMPPLETFPSPRPEREFEIAINCPEFTSLCPKTGEAIKIPAKTVVKARIAKQLKDTVLPKK